jgi:hypothetical protein
MPGGIQVPLDQFLKWPTPNYINPETRPDVILYVACIFGPITFVMLMTRLWVRIFHQRTAGWDDWLMVAGTVRYSACAMYAVLTSIRYPHLVLQ